MLPSYSFYWVSNENSKTHIDINISIPGIFFKIILFLRYIRLKLVVINNNLLTLHVILLNKNISSTSACPINHLPVLVGAIHERLLQ